jgi:hypothetical protein
MPDWHTKLEKELIREYGGTPKEKYGTDGTIDGDPVEVRVAKKDDRFRLNRDTHEELVENDGTYIFDDVTDNIPPREVDADTVDEKIGDDWYSDRGYEHTFLDTDSII